MCGTSLQSCPTLCDPVDHSLPGSSVYGIFQARKWVGCLDFLQGTFMTQGLNPLLAGGFFITGPPVKPTTEVNKSERQRVTDGLATVPHLPVSPACKDWRTWYLPTCVILLCTPIGKLCFNPVVFQWPSMSLSSLQMCLRGSKGLTGWVIYFSYSISAFYLLY